MLGSYQNEYMLLNNEYTGIEYNFVRFRVIIL